ENPQHSAGRNEGEDEVIAVVVLLLAAASRTHTVEIRGMEFHPAELTVAVGDTIVWINRDIVPHTATAGGGAGSQGATRSGMQGARGCRPQDELSTKAILRVLDQA